MLLPSPNNIVSKILRSVDMCEYFVWSFVWSLCGVLLPILVLPQPDSQRNFRGFRYTHVVNLAPCDRLLMFHDWLRSQQNEQELSSEFLLSFNYSRLVLRFRPTLVKIKLSSTAMLSERFQLISSR